MLVTLGQRRTSEDVVDLLLECHHRIRRFIAMAVGLGDAADRPDAEVAEVAAQVRRYFAEALPLHVADEELDLAPRLAGRDPAVDAALATMCGDHADHAGALARLVAICAVLERTPRQHAGLAVELAAVARDLDAQFTAHLALEETVLFPALRALPQAERDALREAMRTRRGVAQ